LLEALFMPQRLFQIAIASGLLSAIACVRVSEQPNVIEDPAAANMVLPASVPRKGPESPRVTMIEIADFQCSYCGKAQATVRSVLDTYPGSVGLAFLNFPLASHENAMACAKAFMAAVRQGQGWAMHDQMFAHQTALSDADLDGYAAALGLDVAQFDADRASQEIAGQIAEQVGLAISLNVDATPTFFIGGYRIVGAQSLSVFTEVVDKVLAGDKPGS
jgi:protein-disulfide isomerase